MNRLHFRVLLLAVIASFVVTMGLVVTVDSVSAQSDNQIPKEIQEIIDTAPEDATEEQIETVQEWYYENGESLPEEVSNRIGSWITTAQNSDSSGGSSSSGSSSGSSETVEDTPENVAVEITEGVVVNSYSFDPDEGTVELVLSSDQYTQQLSLTDPNSTGDSGTGDVAQKGVTVPGGESVRTTMDVEFSQYTNSATVWVSAGAEQTKYVSNSSEPLLSTITWEMIPVAGFSSAMAVFVSGLIYIYRKYRSLNNDYTNVFREI
ncbi:hypothetical protein GOC74_05140 [Halomicrobium mukohataei]|uniref:Uncharacterized protein n=1 Tax=Halomicrobium mukohataei TaxID=57705 RepID=A0A847U7L2_9EURY|nr:hypothetical protein [Halomicrobium mukohataei]NLV09315.1 hypothetical protein [Halomicrobium mukohataei]